MHNILVHVTDDTKNFNCNLSYINCYPFESYLGLLKRYSKTDKSLEQVCRRLSERKKCNKPSISPVTSSLDMRRISPQW